MRDLWTPRAGTHSLCLVWEVVKDRDLFAFLGEAHPGVPSAERAFRCSLESPEERSALYDDVNHASHLALADQLDGVCDVLGLQVRLFT